jgi:glycosyltransferase involved in cell wall biosynthesis
MNTSYGNKKEIVFFYRGEYPNGSNALRTRNMMKGLELNGITTKIIVTYPPPNKIHEHKVSPDEIFTLKPKIFPLKSYQQILLKIVGSIRGYFELLKRKEQITAVFLAAPGFLEGILVYLYCKLHKTRFIVERGDVIRWKYSETKISFVQKLAILQDKLFDKWILIHCDVLFVVSSYLEKEYSNRMPTGRVQRIQPTFINLDEYDIIKNRDLSPAVMNKMPIKSQDIVRVMYAGSCLETNGIKNFLNAADNIYKKDFQKIEILLILNVGRIDEIKIFTSNLSMRNNVYIITGLLYNDVVAIYNTADILVIPEMGDIVANAGFPSKTSEYLASGKAIISTIFSDLGDYLVHEKNAMLSPVKDLHLYQHNLQRLISEKSLREYLGKNGRETARRHFDVTEGVRKIIGYLN